MFDEPTNLDYLFGRACRTHYKVASRHLESLGLHRGQPPLLGALRKKDGRTHSELAKILEVTPATISNMIKRMEKAGLVIRRRDDEDERVSHVYLTENGREVLVSLHDHMQEVEAVAFAGFSDDEKASMRMLLTKMTENLQKSIGGDTAC